MTGQPHRGGTLPHFKRREVSTYIFTIYSSMLAFHAQNSLSGLPLLASEWAEVHRGAQGEGLEAVL